MARLAWQHGASDSLAFVPDVKLPRQGICGANDL
jgi:hypothetical protein